MFASKSIPEHLARGAIGIGAFIVATSLGPQHPGLSLGAIAVALVFLRGCPMCWTLGLVQTVIARVRGKPTTSFCVDGRCALAASPQFRHQRSRAGGHPKRVGFFAGLFCQRSFTKRRISISDNARA